MKIDNYQYGYTGNAVARENMYDELGRLKKAAKIIAVLHDFLGDLTHLMVLDMSCSTGTMTYAFSQIFLKAYGIDIDKDAVDHARKTYVQPNLAFEVMDALSTIFPDNFFDVVVCNQMYEHVPDPDKLMGEVLRLLAPGGVCYFGATSRLKVIETHYGKIPFLSYLPKNVAHRYLKLLGKGDYYYETLYSYFRLKRLVRRFETIDYTLKVIRDPNKYHSMFVLPFRMRTSKWFPVAMHFMQFMFPGFIWLLRKPEGSPC